MRYCQFIALVMGILVVQYPCTAASWRDGLSKGEQQIVLTMLEQARYVQKRILRYVEAELAKLENKWSQEKRKRTEASRLAAGVLRQEIDAHRKLIRRIQRKEILFPPIWAQESLAERMKGKQRKFEAGDVIWRPSMRLRRSNYQNALPTHIPIVWAERISLDGSKLYVLERSFPADCESIKPVPNDPNSGLVPSNAMVLTEQKLVREYGSYKHRWVAEPISKAVSQAFETAQRRQAPSNAIVPTLSTSQGKLLK